MEPSLPATADNILSKEQIIYRVLCAMNNLESIIHQDEDILQIHNCLFNYLKEKCPHEIIQDSVDITPDKSESVYYCKHCFIIPTLGDITEQTNKVKKEF